MSMDKDTFWRVIDAVNSEVKSSNQEGVLRLTREKLLEYTPQEIAAWGGIQRYYKELAHTNGVFAASCCVNDYMSESGFIDFRAWLVSQGKAVYMAALKDPDSLAELDIPEDTRFESYGYIANDVYKKVTGSDLYDEMDRNPLTDAQKEEIRAELAYYPHRIAPERVEAHLPKLYAKHMKPGASLSFSHWPSSPDPQSLMTGLKKLKDAARLIEDMTGCRFKASFGDPFIYPDSNEYLCINMRKEADNGAKRYRVRFDANLQTMGKPMDAAGLMRLQQEVGTAHALLLALEMESYDLTPEEMQAFGDFIHEQEEQREAQGQETGPVMGQTL